MIYSLLIIAFLAFALSSSSLVSATPNGSPKCRIASRSDFTTMANNDGSAEGFTFTASANGQAVTSYTAGQTITFTIDNTATPAKTSFIGFLAFVETPGASATALNQVGSFAAKDLTKFVSGCTGASSAITHSTSAAKSLPFTFTWTAPAAGTGAVTARLAIVADTGFKFQFPTIALTESTTTTTTTAAPVTTTARPSSAHQAGPVMMIIGTMMAMGLAVMKIGF